MHREHTSIAVVEMNANTSIQQILQIGKYRIVDEVPSVGEAVEDERTRGGGIVKVDTQGILRLGLVQEVRE